MNNQVNNQEGVARLYGQMMGQVIEDSHAKFELEGLDTNVLAELSKLWKEKLAVAGMGAFVPEPVAMAGNYGGGAAHRAASDEWGAMPQAGDLGDAAGGILPAGVSIKPETIEQLFQADGGGAGAEGEAGAADAAGGGLGLGEFAVRKPRRGDLVSLSVGPDGQVSGLRIEQVDGAGAGPSKKRKTGEDSYEELEGDDGDLGDEGSELGSDDDDDEEELDTDNLILCQYDKVTRTKAKWKAHLKDGLVHVNLPNGTTRDLVFKTALGDFNFQK